MIVHRRVSCMAFGSIDQIPTGRQLKDGYYHITESEVIISPEGKLMLFMPHDWYEYLLGKSDSVPGDIDDTNEAELIGVLEGG